MTLLFPPQETLNMFKSNEDRFPTFEYKAQPFSRDKRGRAAPKAQACPSKAFFGKASTTRPWNSSSARRRRECTWLWSRSAQWLAEVSRSWKQVWYLPALRGNGDMSCVKKQLLAFGTNRPQAFHAVSCLELIFY